MTAHNSNHHYKNLKNLKIDLGSGINPKSGFVGIDNFVGIKAQSEHPENIDVSELKVINHDLSKGIPFESESVDAVFTSHFLEHVTYLDNLFEEIHRVLKGGCIFEIIVPYANSAEGMYPGHNIFFTEKWFLHNIQFNKFFDIKEIIFYESEYYSNHKNKINKFFTFDEARLFLYNCCWQMQIKCTKEHISRIKKQGRIKYSVVPYRESIPIKIMNANCVLLKIIKKARALFK